MLWSLIAVPTVTILISTMGDTVVGWVKEGTLWLGQKTILPERKSRGHHMKSPKNVERELKEEQTREENESITDVEDSPSRPDEDLEKGRHPDGNAKSKSNRQDADPSVGGGVSRLGSAVGHSERERANKAERDNKYAEASRHDLASRIAGEISSLSMEISHKPAKQYSWEEWKRFLNLLGHEDKETSEWRWLSDHGPLLSGVSETEWILGKLCERLQELLEEGVRRGDEGGEKKKEE